MVAFTVFWRPIYWYGLFYLMTFVIGYMFLFWLGKKKLFENYAWLQTLLTSKLDDLILVILAWVIVGWRLWHVLIYDRAYYSQHLLEILYVRQWGMSFIGWVIWVGLWLRLLMRSVKMSRKELFLLADVILCVVPIGIFLWRIWNFLNQELIWKPLSELSASCVTVIKKLHLNYTYDQIDMIERVNTNIIQSFGEWLLLVVVTRTVLFSRYLKNKVQPWLITGLFLIWYALVRFLVEFWKDLPAQEMWWVLSSSQRFMFLFFIVGIWFVQQSKK